MSVKIQKSISIAGNLQYLYFIFLIETPERWEMLESNPFAMALPVKKKNKRNKNPTNNSNGFRSVIEQFVCFFASSNIANSIVWRV